MAEINRAFREAVAQNLRDSAETFRLGKVTLGSEEVLAEAPVLGLSDESATRFVRITERADHLRIETRNTAFCGTAGANANRTVCHFLRNVFCVSSKKEERLDADRVMLLGMVVDVFTGSSRSAHDLLALFVVGTNDVTARTRAGVDFRDGEVFVDCSIECDFEEVPDTFELALGQVLSHAARIVRFDRLLRDALSASTEPSSRTLQRIHELEREIQTNERPMSDGTRDETNPRETSVTI